jgi:hypothetical protein
MKTKTIRVAIITMGEVKETMEAGAGTKAVGSR